MNTPNPTPDQKPGACQLANIRNLAHFSWIKGPTYYLIIDHDSGEILTTATTPTEANITLYQAFLGWINAKNHGHDK